MRSIVALFVLAACPAHPPPVPPPPGPRDAAVTPPETADGPGLAVEIQLGRRAGGTLAANATIKTHEDFDVTITLDHRAHVYVGGVSASHEAYLISPEPGQSAELDAGTHRIPARSTAWIWLEPPAGPEVLLVIASRRPLVDMDHALAEALGEIELPAEPALAPPAGSATPVDAGTAPPRKPHLKRDKPGWQPNSAALARAKPHGRFTVHDDKVARSDPDGFIVHPIALNHVAP